MKAVVNGRAIDHYKDFDILETGLAVPKYESLYKRVISNGYPPEDFVIDNSLVLNLPFYLLKGSEFKSVDRYKHSCTVTGSLWYPQGRYFDGDDDIKVPDDDSLDCTNITMEAWFTPDDVTTAVPRHICRKHVAYLLQQTEDDIYVYVVVGASYKSVIATAVLTALTSFHIVGTYDGVKIRVYIDGTLDNDKAQTGDMDTNTQDLYIGSQTGTTSYIKGYLGEYRQYNRALSAAEVAHNYNATRWRYK